MASSLLKMMNIYQKKEKKKNHSYKQENVTWLECIL